MEGDRRVEDCDVFQEATALETIHRLRRLHRQREAGSRSTRQEQGRVRSSTQEEGSSFLLQPAAPAPVSEIGAICEYYFAANGNTGAISTGTSLSLSSACCIGGLITANLSSIAFALS